MNAQNAAARPETAHNCGVAGSFNWFSFETPSDQFIQSRKQEFKDGRLVRLFVAEDQINSRRFSLQRAAR